PARALGNATTPTLILHGRNDTRVPFLNGVVLYRALVDVGCPVRFFAYPGAGHGISEPAHIVHMMRQWALWYERYLTGSER
ncbi:MAG: prolyl oligopeptidase family serine peptidase, partial [Myxococcota bacterium]